MVSTKTILRAFIILAVVATTLVVHITPAYSQNLTQGQILTYQRENSYDTRMNQWLDKLEWAESNDNPNLIFLDINHRYSYGEFQYQQATWDRYSKQYGITADIMNPQAQRELTYDIIKHDPDAWTNWYRSTKEIGLPPSLSD